MKVELSPRFIGVVYLQNLEKKPLEILVSPGLNSSFQKIEPFRMHLEPNQEAKAEFRFAEMAQGLQSLHLETSILDREFKGRRKGPAFYEAYQFGPNGFTPVGIEAFLKRRFSPLRPGEKFRPGKIDLGGYQAELKLAPQAFKAHALEGAVQIIPARIDSAMDLATKLKLGQMPAVGKRERAGAVGPTPGFPTPGFPIPHPTVIPGPGPRFVPGVDGFDNLESFTSDRGFPVEHLDLPGMDVTGNSALTIQGHMSTKYNDGSFHASWGWVVSAWQNLQIGPVTMYLPLGWAYVNGDGSWSIALMSLAQQNRQVFVQYETKNRFVSIQDPNGNAYTWGDWWNLSGATTDIGYRYADLSANGDLPGIDKLYQGSTEEWSKFYYNGMNALRNEPIEVTYPNSLASGHCISNDDPAHNPANNYAWSCSEWGNGRIWVIPAHGDKSVVQHEIAHSINSFYWNGNMSAGAGGSHSMYGCYNGGLALTEGFANFVAYWTQFDRSAATPSASYFNENLETFAGDSGCNPGEINELRVAATFWDMYDVGNDGPDATHMDGWYYVDQASPISLYLNNGTQQKMSDYLPIVDAGDPGWFDADRALFRLNRIIN